MNILIVEDENSLANEIASFLKSENFLCDLAFTGHDASEKIAVNLYDFILLDLGLPDYNGLDLINEAKKEQTPFQEFALNDLPAQRKLQIVQKLRAAPPC